MVALNEKELIAKERVCIALDTNSCDEAVSLAKRLSPYAGSFKIGKSLYIIAGFEGRNIVDEIYKVGGKSFLDLKFHDTPDQVYRCARAATNEKVAIFNIHVANGNMCKAAVAGMNDEAKAKKISMPLLIGVTELTSNDSKDLEILGSRWSYNVSILKKAELAIIYGLDGVVCPAKMAGGLEALFGKSLVYVTPGINMGDVFNKGQKQLYEPSNAVQDCSNSILVIGSAITKAENMEAQAYRALQEMAEYV